MPLSVGKKIRIGAIALVIIIVLVLIAAVRPEAYFLNKTVRLVSMRIIQAEEFSRIAREDYKIRFDERDYTTFVRAPGETGEWEKIASEPYPDTLEASMPGFELLLSGGRIVAYGWESQDSRLRSPTALRFFPKKNPRVRHGILFYRDGNWKPMSGIQKLSAPEVIKGL
jgi:hypothetical protein